MEMTFGFNAKMNKDMDTCRNLMDSVSRNAVTELALAELRKRLEKEKQKVSKGGSE